MAGDRRQDLHSLLGSRAEASRDSALVSSTHARQTELTRPLEDFDEGRARAVCGEVTRQLLLDFSPALLLTDKIERLRLQAIITFARTLFDFTNDRSLEGEQFAQINRWHFALDQCLVGEPVGQPVFVLMAALGKQRPWSQEGLHQLVSLARSRILSARSVTTAEVDQKAHELFATVAGIILEHPSRKELNEVGAALFRCHSLLGDPEDLAYRRPDLCLYTGANDPQALGSAVEAECGALAATLSEAKGALADLTPKFRRAFRFACLAGLAISAQARLGPIEHTPRLRVATRLQLLLRARFS